MSLINDALKRARQARPQNPFDGQPVAPLQPVDYAARPNWIFRMIIGLLVLGSLTGAGWFFAKWWSSGPESRGSVRAAAEPASAEPAKLKRHDRQPIKVSTNIIVRTNRAVAVSAESAPESAATNPAGITLPTSAATVATETNVAVPPAPPSPFADLKLQSIIYREDKPAVVINGEMLFVGDEIRGARVTGIERQSVTVERKGETNELRLPRL
ncbi:MAG TPA: hypothetical protein VN887_07510 [Candidatus Angelobacter sp.]|nr:hypothetical protein [Candidatus Angelobacter sp.]